MTFGSEIAMGAGIQTAKVLAVAALIWGLLMFAAGRLWENYEDNQHLEAEIERSAKLNEKLQDRRDARRDEVLEQLR